MRKIFGLVVVGLVGLALFGCGGASVSEKAEVAFLGDDYSYDGQFFDETFDHISQNINLDGVKVAMPCTFADLGGGFSVEFKNVDQNNSYTSYDLYHVGKGGERRFIGYLLYESDHMLSDKELRSQKFIHLYILPDEQVRGDSSVAGVRVGDGLDKVVKLLGEPDSGDYDGKNGDRFYDVSKYKWVDFVVEDNVVTQIIVRSKEKPEKP